MVLAWQEDGKPKNRCQNTHHEAEGGSASSVFFRSPAEVIERDGTDDDGNDSDEWQQGKQAKVPGGD